MRGKIPGAIAVCMLTSLLCLASGATTASARVVAAGGGSVQPTKHHPSKVNWEERDRAVYEFGWKFPTGVRSYHCVAKAQPGIVKGYGSKAWRFIARFRTTYPQN